MNRPELSQFFADELDCFLECTDARQLNRILRCFLMADKHGFPSFHESLLSEIDILFYFIEEVGKEQRRRKHTKKTAAALTITLKKLS